MRYTVTCDSDVGRVRKTNQDAVMVKHISLSSREIVFAVLCDGMGGLDEGEVASTSVVTNFLKWFDSFYLPQINKFGEEIIFRDWQYIIKEINSELYQYGNRHEIKVGTTVTVMLVCNMEYYILNIGDGRVYELTNHIRQLTEDHSVVAREVKKGRLSLQEARFDSRRNQLLRSVGVTKETKADFYKGKISEGAVYMLCCDGVRNKIYDEEILYYFHPQIMINRNVMENNIRYVLELNKYRQENDNMSVILIKDNETTIVLQSNETEILVTDEKIIASTDKIIDIDWSGIR